MSFRSRRLQRRLIAAFRMVAISGVAVVSACATIADEPLPPTVQAAAPTNVAPATLPPVLPTMPPLGQEPWEVHAMRGKSTLEWRGRRWRLKPGTEVESNQPVEVAFDAALRLRLGQRALVDLGPESRFVILERARDGQSDVRATSLRLERGYLRVVASEDGGVVPIRVSFGRWSARIGSGEHFFEADGSQAYTCSTNGPIELDGAPDWKPRSSSAPCVMLKPGIPAVEISLQETQWEVLRRNRQLHPTLASVTQQSAATAMVSLDGDAQRVAPEPPAPVDAQAMLDAAPPAAGRIEPPPAVDPIDAQRPEWIVNVETYEDAQTAQHRVRELQGQGFNAAMRQEAIKNRASYRVVIEGLPNESAAKSVIADLGTRFGVNSAWAMRKR